MNLLPEVDWEIHSITDVNNDCFASCALLYNVQGAAVCSWKQTGALMFVLFLCVAPEKVG